MSKAKPKAKRSGPSNWGLPYIRRALRELLVHRRDLDLHLRNHESKEGRVPELLKILDLRLQTVEGVIRRQTHLTHELPVLLLNAINELKGRNREFQDFIADVEDTILKAGDLGRPTPPRTRSVRNSDRHRTRSAGA